MPSKIGAYEVLGTIGRGSSGVVYLAEQTELGGGVALKELAPRLAAAPGFVERFRREAEIMARLDHPNCARVWEFFETGGSAYLAMEYIPGASLRAVSRQAGRLSPEQALGVLRGALSGLAHAHSLGLTHRDLKPENIIADPEGTSKLIDFGQAIAAGDRGEASVSSGTPAYMSPEQARGEAGDVRSDLYSAGVILFELLTGEPPFAGESPLVVMRKHISEPTPDARRLNPNLSERTAMLVARAMAKDPGKRHQTAAEFLAALEEAARDAYGAGWEAASSIRALVAAAAAGAVAGEQRRGKQPREAWPRESGRQESVPLPPPRRRRRLCPQPPARRPRRRGRFRRPAGRVARQRAAAASSPPGWRWRGSAWSRAREPASPGSGRWRPRPGRRQRRRPRPPRLRPGRRRAAYRVPGRCPPSAPWTPTTMAPRRLPTTRSPR